MAFAAWHRLFALALAGLWAVLPLAGALHDAGHAHRYCAEHGAVEEAGDPEGLGADADAEGLHAERAPGEDLHTACAFSFAHRLGADASPPRLSPGPGPQVASACTVLAPEAPGVTGLPVLARAPKASPPAA